MGTTRQYNTMKSFLFALVLLLISFEVEGRWKVTKKCDTAIVGTTFRCRNRGHCPGYCKHKKTGAAQSDNAEPCFFPIHCDKSKGYTCVRDGCISPSSLSKTDPTYTPTTGPTYSYIYAYPTATYSPTIGTWGPTDIYAPTADPTSTP